MSSDTIALTTEIREIRIGVSACLLGEPVRFDGRHKRHLFIVTELAKLVELIPYCPEVAAGMSVPRPPIQLYQSSRGKDTLQVVDVSNVSIDHTKAIKQAGSLQTQTLRAAQVCGYIFKSKSPSCGLYNVPVHRNGHPPRGNGRGIFASTLTDEISDIPAIEETQLANQVQRECFIKRAVAFNRLRRAFHHLPPLAQLITFHASEEMTLRAHQPGIFEYLKRLIEQANESDLEQLTRYYQQSFLATLKIQPSMTHHHAILEQILHQLEPSLGADQRHQLRCAIDNASSLGGFDEAIEKTRKLAQHCQNNALTLQSYLNPHPIEIALRRNRSIAHASVIP